MSVLLGLNSNIQLNRSDQPGPNNGLRKNEIIQLTASRDQRIRKMQYARHVDLEISFHGKEGEGESAALHQANSPEKEILFVWFTQDQAVHP